MACFWAPSPDTCGHVVVILCLPQHLEELWAAVLPLGPPCPPRLLPRDPAGTAMAGSPAGARSARARSFHRRAAESGEGPCGESAGVGGGGGRPGGRFLPSAGTVRRRAGRSGRPPPWRGRGRAATGCQATAAEPRLPLPGRAGRGRSGPPPWGGRRRRCTTTRPSSRSWR